MYTMNAYFSAISSVLILLNPSDAKRSPDLHTAKVCFDLKSASLGRSSRLIDKAINIEATAGASALVVSYLDDYAPRAPHVKIIEHDLKPISVKLRTSEQFHGIEIEYNLTVPGKLELRRGSDFVVAAPLPASPSGSYKFLKVSLSANDGSTVTEALVHGTIKYIRSICLKY